ncbi:NADH-quinone oxidoreductase subunit N [Candidatus Sumerlaeota bacterium]|nr:NADH-quinone oxidoreductase subunit N [Candidatus Sumerlaeota bacterium]
MQMPHIIWPQWLPFLIPLIGGIGVLLFDVFSNPESSRKACPAGAVATCLLALIALYKVFADVAAAPAYLPAEYPVFMISQFSRDCIGIILLGAALLLTLSPRGIAGKNIRAGEYYGLFLLSVLGMMLMAASVELLTLFICLELASLSIYVLIGIEKSNANSGEAALKYFVLGSFASAFLIFGAAFFYGHARTTFLISESHQLVIQGIAPYIALGLILVGLAFKLALAPFHLYAPEVYDGAPTPVSALLATGIKVAGFCVLAQALVELRRWDALDQGATWALVLLALASVIIGNCVALVQRRIKRLLAYSSIAHSGYLLLGIVVLSDVAQVGTPQLALTAISVYLLAYTLMNVVSFGVASSLGGRFEEELSNYAGLAKSHPFMAAALTVSLISLTGLPPTVGFIGKFYVFAEAAKTSYIFAVAVAVVFSVLSAFYYLNIVMKMYMQEQEEGAPGVERTLACDVALGVSMALILLLGIAPGLLFWMM